MELRIGDYVRTVDRGIRKIEKWKDDIWYLDTQGRINTKDNIIKSSPNIIDLIEVGDYINGHLVVAIDDEGFIETEVGYDLEQGELLSQEDIKSILTKEQFESMEYKVKE